MYGPSFMRIGFILAHPNRLLKLHIFKKPVIDKKNLLMDLVASFPHIRWKGIRFGNPCGSLGWLKSSTCHNQIGVPSLGLEKALVGDTLYYIIGHSTESTKKQNKCMFVWSTKISNPSFKHPLTQLLKSGMGKCMNRWTVW